jgi:hypothetical protein
MILSAEWYSVLCLLLHLSASVVKGESRIKTGEKEAELEKRWGFDVVAPNLPKVGIS